MVQAPTQLPKRALGKTGVQVSCVGMGCSPFGHAYGVRLQGSAELESLSMSVATLTMMLCV
jgi:aryl-alcohol dehydrogenase-like predicted oxidoreductase